MSSVINFKQAGHDGGLSWLQASIAAGQVTTSGNTVTLVQLPNGQTVQVHGVIQAAQPSVIQSPQVQTVQVRGERTAFVFIVALQHIINPVFLFYCPNNNHYMLTCLIQNFKVKEIAPEIIKMNNCHYEHRIFQHIVIVAVN